MSELLLDKAIQRGLPVEKYGLRFYPIKVESYEEYHSLKSAWLLRQSTLPATYASMRFLEAVWALDFDMCQKGGDPTGLFSRIAVLLAMALQAPPEAIEQLVHICTDPENERRITALRVRQNDVIARITPAQFDEIRRLVAEQNGDDLPDESENPELVRAESEYASIVNQDTEFSVENALDSVAYCSQTPKKDIYEWTIRDFEIRRRTIRRDKYFTLYTSGELTGMVKFPKGNPYPSYEFDRANAAPASLKPEEQVLHKFGQTADNTMTKKE